MPELIEISLNSSAGHFIFHTWFLRLTVHIFLLFFFFRFLFVVLIIKDAHRGGGKGDMIGCGLVVKAEDSRLKGCGFKSPLRRPFFRHHSFGSNAWSKKR